LHAHIEAEVTGYKTTFDCSVVILLRTG